MTFITCFLGCAISYAIGVARGGGRLEEFVAWLGICIVAGIIAWVCKRRCKNAK